MEEEMQEFSILDPVGMNTVAFVIESENADGEEVYTLKMLENEAVEESGKTKKTFFVETEYPMDVTVLMLTIGKSKVVMTSAILADNELTVIKKPDIVKYQPIVNKEGDNEFRDFKYTKNLKRPISIVDTETGEEIKPVVYIDPETGEISGKCKMMPYRAYIAIEVTD